MANEKKLVTYDNIQQYHNQLSQVVGRKQDSLVSGTNIKTINGTSILGSGNIVISGGGGEGTDMSNYYTKEEIDNTTGDISTILESIINGSDTAVNTVLEEIINL